MTSIKITKELNDNDINITRHSVEADWTSINIDSQQERLIVRPDGTQILCDSPNSSELPPYDGQLTKKKQHKPTSEISKPKRTIGNYTLVNTLGSGSMGKVRLAVHNLTGDKLAVKIVPRRAVKDNTKPNKKQENDESREIRTVREASIMLLLHHPYIVSLKEMVILDPYYYLFMEYVNGGQLLDYIISHGKLREKQARRFARQILSALDYCHRNSIVHRDLKIENILISQSGNIKIIDFGLSNLFSPQSSLNTFCGSLYFAAPELLNAKAYTGPEVDVWSFGVVLYVLVCGKVPFDDQSMPALHEKIKRGVVEYPSHLSTDCKSILSRMLVINPAHRATVSELMIHTWINKGYDAPVDNYLLDRTPLTLPIDMDVVRGMTGFEFGTENEIRDKLEEIITSEDYQKASRKVAERRAHQQLRHGSLASKFSSHPKSYHLSNDDPQSVPYAYHPLVSIYYLVKEKMEREHRLSSTSSKSSMHLADEYVHPSTSTEQKTHEHESGDKLHFIENGLTRLFSRSSHHHNRSSSQSNQSSNADNEDHENRDPNTIFRRLSHALTKTSTETRQRKQSTCTDELSSPVSTSTSTPIQIPSRSQSPTKHKHDGLSKTFTPISTKFPTSLFSSPSRHAEPTDFEIATAAAAAAANISSNQHNNKLGNKISKMLPRRMTLAQSSINAENHNNFLNMVHNQQSTKVSGTNLPNVINQEGDLGLIRPQHDHEQTFPPVADESTSLQQIGTADENIRPVFLKGLFSVTTTSTKHPSVIRADLIRVLERIGVKWRESKGRFECVHMPSIDLNHVVNTNANAEDIFTNIPPSFSFDDVPVNSPVVAVPDLVVRFEIYIVKVPWLLGMHGLQFRRVGGDPWQYKNMCSKILAELKL